MTPAKLLGEWLFNVLGGVFVENGTLYLTGEVDNATLVVDNVTVDNGDIVGYSLTEGRVYPIATKEDVKCPYVIYDSVAVQYGETKDGPYAQSVTARILAVDKTQAGAEGIADKAEKLLSGAPVKTLGSACKLEARANGYDAATREYLEELRITIEL